MASWITVLSRHTVFTKRAIYRLLWCDIPLNKAPHTGPCHVWRTYILCLFSGREKNRQQWSWVDDCAGQCWLWQLSSHTFVAAALGLPTNLGVGWSWLFPASSFKFLTRRSLKSRFVYLAPQEDNNIQLLSTVRSRRWKNIFMGHLKVRRLTE